MRFVLSLLALLPLILSARVPLKDQESLQPPSLAEVSTTTTTTANTYQLVDFSSSSEVTLKGAVLSYGFLPYFGDIRLGPEKDGHGYGYYNTPVKIGTDGFTISFIAMLDFADSDSGAVILHLTSSGNNNSIMIHRQGTDTSAICTTITDQSGNVNKACVANVVPANQYFMYSITIAADGSWNVYIDGVLKSSNRFSDSLAVMIPEPATGRTAYFGRRFDAESNYLVGRIESMIFVPTVWDVSRLQTVFKEQTSVEHTFSKPAQNGPLIKDCGWKGADGGPHYTHQGIVTADGECDFGLGSSYIGNSDFTFEFWIQSNDDSNNQAGASLFNTYVTAPGSTVQKSQFYVKRGDPSAQVGGTAQNPIYGSAKDLVYGYCDGSTCTQTISSKILLKDKWQYIAVVHSAANKTVSFYVDGVAMSVATNFASPPQLDRGHTKLIQGFKGALDYFALSLSIKTAAEIKSKFDTYKGVWTTVSEIPITDHVNASIWGSAFAGSTPVFCDRDATTGQFKAGPPYRSVLRGLHRNSLATNAENSTVSSTTDPIYRIDKVFCGTMGDGKDMTDSVWARTASDWLRYQWLACPPGYFITGLARNRPLEDDAMFNIQNAYCVRHPLGAKTYTRCQFVDVVNAFDSVDDSVFCPAGLALAGMWRGGFDGLNSLGSLLCCAPTIIEQSFLETSETVVTNRRRIGKLLVPGS